jgi:hypothetical protein
MFSSCNAIIKLVFKHTAIQAFSLLKFHRAKDYCSAILDQPIKFSAQTRKWILLSFCDYQSNVLAICKAYGYGSQTSKRPVFRYMDGLESLDSFRIRRQDWKITD